MPSAKKNYFVTGTDTEVGKTFCSVALLQAANAKGLRTLGLKPVAAGSETTSDGERNEDALALMEVMTTVLPYEQVNPAVFKTPASPHISAALENKSVSISRLAGFCRGAMMSSYDFGLIEGAGGWRVPVNNREYLSQLPVALNLPVILVVGMRLGCINHALLSAEAIRADGLQIAGWIANSIDPDMGFLQENIQTLKGALQAPCIAEIPYSAGMAPAELSDAIKIDLLLENA
ncbi:MAG: dethiobiotin synthase [Gammaproteobacteria bacterium]|nr:MAG: dethiobiotin synthase [Gammaproteobacteria bacterium]